MFVRCIQSLDELASLRKSINALNLHSSAPDPFSTYEFFENVVRSDPSFENGKQTLWFLAAMRNEDLVGYMALKHTQRSVLGARSNQLGFLVGHDGDRPHVVSMLEDQCAVADLFFNYLCSRDDWDLLEFEQQPADSFLLTPPEDALCNFRFKLWPNMDNYTIPIRWQTLNAYFNSLSRTFRADVKRGLRRLFSAGDVQLLTTSDQNSTSALLQLYCMIESKSWKTSTNLGIDHDNIRRARYSGLLDARQPLRISIHVLLLNGVPVAGLINGSFGFNNQRQLYALEMVFDDRFSASAPGSAILLLGVRHAIERRCSTYNLLSGFGHYKTRWLAEPTATHSAQLYRVGSLPFWKRRLGDGRRRLFGTRSTQGHLISRRQVGMSIANQLESTAISASERTAAATLIAEAQKGRLECLSRQQLVELMPFDIDDVGDKKRAIASRVSHVSAPATANATTPLTT